jgi:hypothetical protein
MKVCVVSAVVNGSLFAIDFSAVRDIDSCSWVNSGSEGSWSTLI